MRADAQSVPPAEDRQKQDRRRRQSQQHRSDRPFKSIADNNSCPGPRTPERPGRPPPASTPVTIRFQPEGIYSEKKRPASHTGTLLPPCGGPRDNCPKKPARSTTGNSQGPAVKAPPDTPRPDVACSRSRSTTDRSSRNCAAKNAASHSDTPCYPAGDITEEDGVETEPGCQVDTDSAPSDDFDDKEADDPLTECESEQDVEWAEEKKNSLLTECRRRIRYCCKRRMLKVRDAYMSGKAVCMIILFDVFVPSGIVWALGFLADQVAKTEQWGDEVYNISRNITEAQPTNWLVEKVKPAIDVGTESHELVGLVLGFLLAYQAQRAADSFMRAETDLQEMCACLKEGALACLPNFKQCKKSRGGAQIHWQFARSLSVLLLMAMRDLQVGSTEGVLEAQETWQTLLELGISAAEHNALKKAKPDMRVYLSLHWVRMLVDAAVAYKWLKQEPAKKARGSLDQFILKWKDARFVAYAEKPRMFQGLLSMLIYMFCFTLPFPLAAKLADYGKIVAVFVSLAFFAVKAAADQMSEPFGFDRNDLNLERYYRDFEGFLPDVVHYVSWHPVNRSIPIPWQQGELDPGCHMKQPPGNASLQLLLAKYSRWHFGLSSSISKDSLDKLLCRQSKLGSVEEPPV